MADSTEKNHPPQRSQPRARRTRTKMLEALDRLLQQKPFDQIAVTEIAHEAGVAVGSVYSHFAHKEAFLEALLDEWRGRIEARLAEAYESDLEAELRAQGNLRAALHMIVQYNHDQLEQDKHIIRAIHDHLRQQAKDTDMREWAQLSARAYETVAVLVDVFADEVKRQDRRKTADMLNYYLSAIFTDRIIYEEREALGMVMLSDTDFVHEVAEMAYAYMTTAD